MAHLPGPSNLSFLYLTFNQQPNPCCKSGIKAFTQSLFTRSMLASSGNTRTMWEICSKLIIKTQIRSQWGRSGTFTVNYQYIAHIFLAFPLLTFSKTNILKNNNRDARTTYIKMILEYVPEAPTKVVAGGVIHSPPDNILERRHYCLLYLSNLSKKIVVQQQQFSLWSMPSLIMLSFIISC